jgi:broad specificity phosphatase PhoE
MVRDYFRHSDKTGRNGQGGPFPFDPAITEKGKIRARQTAIEQVRKDGYPAKIFCSPFRRCRETAIEMYNAINEMWKEKTGEHDDIDIPIHIDVLLSEYLGNHSPSPEDLTESTLKYNPPLSETMEMLKNRAAIHNQLMQELDSCKDDKNNNVHFWFISHGIVIEQIAGAMGFYFKKRLDFMANVSFNSTRNESVMCISNQGRNLKIRHPFNTPHFTPTLSSSITESMSGMSISATCTTHR